MFEGGLRIAMGTDNKDKKPEDKRRKGSALRKYAQLSGVGFQMGATIFLFAYAGKKLDAHYQLHKDWFTIIFVLLGVAVSIYVLLKQLKNINKE